MKPLFTPPQTTAPDEAESPLKFVLVSFRDLQQVDDHPELQSYLLTGWDVRDVEPRLVEGEGPKLLVVLHRALDNALPFSESKAA